MIRQWIILPLCVLPLGVSAVQMSSSQPASLTAGPGKGGVEVNAQSLFRYEAGLLSGNAKKETLATVLSALSRTAKLKAMLRYKPEANEVVSFNIKDKVLTEALKEVLRGYNYIYIPTAGSGEVSKLILLGKVSAEVAAAAPALERKLIESSEPVEDSETGDMKQKLAGPWGLDEFRRLKTFCQPVAEADEYRSKQKTEIAAECRDREALEREDKLVRALDALDTNYRNLKEAALAELQGIDDPEAANALLNMALNEDDMELQQLAAQALWQHAADLGFKDPDANQALKVLAKDGDSIVKDYGQKALEDAKRYTKHIKDASGG